MISQQRINELIDSLALDPNIATLLRQVEAEAYEAAAEICDRIRIDRASGWEFKLCGSDAAAAIRALKSTGT